MSGQHLEAVIVGAGFGGMGAAIQLKELGYDNFVILERGDDLGGTWYFNHYPGLAVDIPSTTYSYWFEPNPYWSRLFATGGELNRYAHHVADKYDVRRHMRFNTSVEGARWEEETQLWRLTLTGGDTVATRYLITATGFLSQPVRPDIPGIDGFGGRIIHTTDWDDAYDPTGDRVGLIGTGATAVQLVPELAKSVTDLTVYQRTPIWVAPKADFGFAPAVQRLFARVPLAQRTVRFVTDYFLELLTGAGVLKYPYFRRLSIVVMDMCKLHRFISVRDKKTRRALAPDYDIGCKRPSWSNDYYRSFNRPHVHLQANSIERIEPDGIRTTDGNKTVIDTLVLATGFDLWEANFPAIEVIGRNGRNLGKWWRDNRFQAYQGMSIPHLPNYLSLASPYAFCGLSFFNTMEYQMRHMDRLFGEVQRRGATTFEVTEEANNRFLDRMTRRLDTSVFYAGDCASSRSYYFNHHGEASLLRPTSVRNAVRDGSNFPLNDYAIA
jgi:cation diffusion facilitator CzcD-associated flavoprotein CzcO